MLVYSITSSNQTTQDLTAVRKSRSSIASKRWLGHPGIPYAARRKLKRPQDKSTSKDTPPAHADKHPTFPPTDFKGRCFFLEIPVELRLFIFEHVFFSPRKYSSSYKDVLQYVTAIIYTNHQIFAEVIPGLRMCGEPVLDRFRKKTIEAVVSYNGSLRFSRTRHMISSLRLIIRLRMMKPKSDTCLRVRRSSTTGASVLDRLQMSWS